MLELVETRLVELGLTGELTEVVAVVVAFTGVVLLAAIVDLLVRVIIVRTIRRAVRRSLTTRGDLLMTNRVFERLSHLALGIILNQLGPLALAPYPELAQTLEALTLIYITLVVTRFLNALVDVVLAAYETCEFAHEFPITSLGQVAKLIIYVVGTILVVSLLLGESPITLFTALGALAAGATFVFKDAILGFVAGLQLTANRMVAVGDWIEMPKHGVDGDVMEIALTTVKIRNFDRTITTIPTYSLISSSFKNWRGMQESGGRRVKRSINVDLATVRFCDEQMLARFARMRLLREYLAEKQKELAEYNEGRVGGESPTTDGRRLTNVGSFRAYLTAYLRAHPKVKQNLMLLVRQLAPTSEGLPIELYFFVSEIQWTEYEKVQADVFDHVFACAHEFGLRIFQSPTGSDVLSASLPAAR